MSAYSTGRTRPFTGQEYLESLRDGREIYIYGERVKDVTTHPAFRNTARMIARLYDALHDPEKQDKSCTMPTDTGSGGIHARVLQGARRTSEEIGRRPRRDRRVGADDLRLDGPQPGLQGGVPRHARRQRRASTRRTRTNAKRWYKSARSEVPFVNHAIVNPPVDRDKPLGRGRRRLHARREGDRRGPHRQRARRSWRPGRR